MNNGKVCSKASYNHIIYRRHTIVQCLFYTLVPSSCVCACVYIRANHLFVQFTLQKLNGKFIDFPVLVLSNSNRMWCVHAFVVVYQLKLINRKLNVPATCEPHIVRGASVCVLISSRCNSASKRCVNAIPVEPHTILHFYQSEYLIYILWNEKLSNLLNDGLIINAKCLFTKPSNPSFIPSIPSN